MDKVEVKKLLYDTLDDVLENVESKVEDKEISDADKRAFNLQTTLTITMYICEVIKKLDNM